MRTVSLIASSAIALLFSSANVVAATLIVDDDGQNCPNATFTSIQAAVTAAAPGDTIKVCAGLYNETVTVNKTLKLDGAGPDPKNRTGNPAKEAVVTSGASPGYTFNLSADNIELTGFTVQGQTNGPGVYTSSLSSGYQIRKNLIRNNVFGLYLHSSGALETVVRQNAFNNNNAGGSGGGNGIYSDQGLQNATIRENFFTGHTSAAMVFAGTQSDLLITGNDTVDDSSIVLFNTTDVEVSHNKSIRHDGSGILLGGEVANAVVANNTLQDGTGTGISENSTGLFSFGPNSNVTIEKNHISGAGGNGIRVAGAPGGHKVLGNQTDGNVGDGIRIFDSNGNTIDGNKSDSNGSDGIQVTGASSGNVLTMNKMMKNVEHDAHDDNRPANTWTKNQCKTDLPSGSICK